MKLKLLPGLLIGFSTVACGAAPSDQAQPDRVTGSTSAAVSAAAEPVTIEASDGVTIHGAHYRAADPKALILLFHQAGSNKSEYASIAPRLVGAGFSALAIDQRSGGDMFGGRNQTVAKLGNSANYLDAKRDLIAALGWARDKQLPVVLWGSSYSASLLFSVSAENQGRIAALLSFSPGEYLDDNNGVSKAAARVNIPVFITSSRDPEEVAAAKAIFEAVASSSKVQFVPRSVGAHGSSALIPARNRNGAEESWREVLAFLGGIGK